MRAQLTVLAISITIVLMASVSLLSEPSFKSNEISQFTQSFEGDHFTVLAANNLALTVSNHGRFGPEIKNGTHQTGAIYPLVSLDQLDDSIFDPYVLWMAGAWIRGKVNGELRVTASGYTDGYTPGPIVNETYVTPDSSHRVYKLYSDSMENNPNQDYLDWPVHLGAPVDDAGKPKLSGQQTLWTVFNDVDPNRQESEASSIEPLGVEVQLTAWASKDDGDIKVPLQWSLDLTKITSGGPRLISAFVNITDHSLLTGHDYQLVVREDQLLGPIAEITDLTTSAVIVSDFPLEVSSSIGNVIETSLGFRVVIYRMSNGFESFQVVANGGGLLDPPVAGALPEQDFPTGYDSVGNQIELTDRQQLGDGMWAIHRAGRLTFEDFLMQYYVSWPKQFYIVDEYDFEIRFTGDPADPSSGGSYATAFEADRPIFWVPFEVWNIGTGTVDDTSDDYRLIPLLREVDKNRVFALENWGTEDSGSGYFEHIASSGDDDPFTDIFTGYVPGDNSPGEAGYLANVNAMNNGTFWNSYSYLREQPGWWVLINVDGGSAPPFNQDMPEQGTVFRITKTSHIPVDTFQFTASASQIRTSGPEGMSVYLQYKMYNKSDHPIDSFYFSFFAEPNNDVGVIACDTLDDLFICYSGSDFIDEFGFWPPAVGCKIIHGLLTPSPGEIAQFSGQEIPDYANLGMTALGAYHINGSFPNSAIESDWRIRAHTFLWPQGEPYVYNGDTLSYIYSGDPVTGTGDVSPRWWRGRVWQSCGPVQFLPGDSQYILLKLAVGQGESRLESIVSLREILNMPFQIPTSVEDDNNPTLPERFVLYQNYPNPFNAGTTIEYSLPRRSHVTIEVFNVLGQRVRLLVDREKSAGSYTITWDGTNHSGQLVASGVYLYRFQAGDHIETKKMQLLK